MSDEKKPEGYKEGYRTTEFWLMCVAWIVGLALDSGLIGSDSFVYQGLGTLSASLATAGYAYSRGKLKEVLDMGKKGLKTTEYWLTAVAVVVGALVSSGVIGEDTVIYKWLGIVGSALAALGYSVSRGIAKKPAKQVQ